MSDDTARIDELEERVMYLEHHLAVLTALLEDAEDAQDVFDATDYARVLAGATFVGTH